MERKREKACPQRGGGSATQDQRLPEQGGVAWWGRAGPDRSFTHGGPFGGLWKGRCASMDALTGLHPLAHDIPWIP